MFIFRFFSVCVFVWARAHAHEAFWSVLCARLGMYLSVSLLSVRAVGGFVVRCALALFAVRCYRLLAVVY